jgi:hypothetical protein
MKETQRLLMVQLDHDYDLDNERFSGAFKNLEKICADMEKELGIDIELQIEHKTESIGNGMARRRNTQVYMVIDTMALGIMKLATGQNVLYSEGIVHRNNGWCFIWRERPQHLGARKRENA